MAGAAELAVLCAPARGRTTKPVTRASRSLIVHPHYRHTLPILKATGSFEGLPLCVLHRIAGFLLSPQDLVTMERVSTRCRCAASDDELWHKMLVERFGWQPQQAPPSWRALYKFQHELFFNVVLRQAADTLLNMRLNSLGRGVPLGFAINVM